MAKANSTKPAPQSIPDPTTDSGPVRTPAELADDYIAQLLANPKDEDLNLSNYVAKLAHDEDRLVDFAYDVHSRLQELSVQRLTDVSGGKGDRSDEHKVSQRIWEAQSVCALLAEYASAMDTQGEELNHVENAASAINTLLKEAGETFLNLTIAPKPVIEEGGAA
ncbi:MAG: hypothetical protein JWN13_3316 [Betaproteobacteria bacterium]|jgi:hypothetical protein|nr:hypothetical protein [Betaproteobacteria bacterium]